jgi:hypothetical protein
MLLERKERRVGDKVRTEGKFLKLVYFHDMRDCSVSQRIFENEAINAQAVLQK